MRWIRKYLHLPSFLVGQETPDEGDDESDSESVSSDISYKDCLEEIEQEPPTDNVGDDCLDEIEQEPPTDNAGDDRKARKTKQGSPAKCFVYPPLSSIAANTAAFASCTLDAVGFVPVSVEDDFDQSITPFTSSDSQQSSAASSVAKTKKSTVYKSELQTYCQRRKLILPSYHHGKEGPCHAPKFRAAVVIDGETFSSPSHYTSKAEAEQAAAEVALAKLCQEPNSHYLPMAVSSARIKSPCKVETPITRFVAEHPQRTSFSVPSTLSDTNDRLVGTGQGFGLYASIADDPIPFEDLLKMDESHHDLLMGDLKGNQSGRHASSVKVTSQLNQPTSKRENRFEWPKKSEHLIALGKLDFSTQAFPLLTTLAGQSLESVYAVTDIGELGNVQANDVGRYLKAMSRTRIHVRTMGQIDPSFIHYNCYVDSEGRQRFEISKNMQGNTLLQRVLGFDKVLRVFFQCGPKERSSNFDVDVYKKIAKSGIFVGYRLYQYFVHKPSDAISTDEEKRTLEGSVKCYFVCTNSIGTRDREDRNFKRFSSITDARCHFMHVHQCPTIPKYIVRLQLCLSKTMTINVPWEQLTIEEIEDLPSKDPATSDILFTDGTGYISSDLAKLMPVNVFKGIKSDDNQDHPSLVQVRIFYKGSAYKGTLLKDDRLAPNTLVLRKSMRKVQRDSCVPGRSIRSLELVATSQDPREAKLSQDLILLLSMGGVSEGIFVEAVHKAIARVEMVFKDRKAAFDALGDWEGGNIAKTALPMVAAGIPLDEPGLQKKLLDLTRNRLHEFSKGKFPLDGTFYLMGTADPTDTLKSNEVVIFRGKEQVYGTVLLYRAPGKHPGDIHKVEAVCSRNVVAVVGQVKNVIFFPTQGTRPLPHQIGKGDLDGDRYWVCRNPEVVELFREWDSRWYPGKINSKPRADLKPVKMLSPDELEEALFDEYLNEQLHRRETIVGFASLRWSTHADAYLHPDTTPPEKQLHLEELLKYPDYIYESIDNKSELQFFLPSEHKSIRGAKPSYLLKDPTANSTSNANGSGGKRSILGKIYDIVQSVGARWQCPTYHPEHFQQNSAFYVPHSEQYKDKWFKILLEYNSEMREALILNGMEDYNPNTIEMIKSKYKMLLYGAPSLAESTNLRQQVLEEASAIYAVVYSKADQDLYCERKPTVAFAWDIAGDALVDIFFQNQHGGNSIRWSAGALKEVHKYSKNAKDFSLSRSLF